MKTSLILSLLPLLFVQCQWYQNLPRTDYESDPVSTHDYLQTDYPKQTDYVTLYNAKSDEYPPPHAEPGKCYAKCMMPDVYDIEGVQLAIYTGKEGLENIELEVRAIEIEPTLIETYTIVVDTTQTDNYEIVNIKIKELVEKRGFTEWRDVLCPGDVTVDLVHQVQDRLKAYGYDSGPLDDIMGKRMKTALTQFQKDNGLPIGNFDFQTLDVLNINY